MIFKLTCKHCGKTRIRIDLNRERIDRYISDLVLCAPGVHTFNDLPENCIEVVELTENT